MPRTAITSVISILNNLKPLLAKLLIRAKNTSNLDLTREIESILEELELFISDKILQTTKNYKNIFNKLENIFLLNKDDLSPEYLTILSEIIFSLDILDDNNTALNTINIDESCINEYAFLLFSIQKLFEEFNEINNIYDFDQTHNIITVAIRIYTANEYKELKKDFDQILDENCEEILENNEIKQLLQEITYNNTNYNTLVKKLIEVVSYVNNNVDDYAIPSIIDAGQELNNLVNFMKENEFSYCISAKLPAPQYQRAQTCKLYMLYYLLLHNSMINPRQTIPPVRKKMITTTFDNQESLSSQMQYFNWKTARESNTKNSSIGFATTFFCTKEQLSIRKQAKIRGSKVGEVYDARMLTTLASDFFFNAGYYAPEKTDYLETIKKCLHLGIAVGVFFDIERSEQLRETVVVNIKGTNEHAGVIVGYYFNKENKLFFILLNWNKYTFIDADKLLTSTFQLSDNRIPETFSYHASDDLTQPKWINSTKRIEDICKEDPNIRVASPLLDGHIPLNGKIFTVTRERNEYIETNLDIPNPATLVNELNKLKYYQELIPEAALLAELSPLTSSPTMDDKYSSPILKKRDRLDEGTSPPYKCIRR